MLSISCLSPVALILFAMALRTSAQSEAQKVASLRSVATAVDRIELLQDNEFVFDFLHPEGGVTTGAAGHTVAASSADFPGLIGNGIAMTIGFLGPCGLNTPHTHPRATEINFVVNGTLQAGFLAENGARFVFNEVPAGSASIFPKGAIHFEMNNGCEDALFVAAFNDEDPGVNQVAQRLFGLPPSFVAATLGDIGVEQVAGLEAMIPDNIALGTDECLKRCGLTRGHQPTNQRQPRVSANSLPAGFTGPTPPAGSSPTPSGNSVVVQSSSTQPPTSSPSMNPRSLMGISENFQAEDDKKGKTSPLVVALSVVSSLLAVGYVALAGVYFLRRRHETMSRTQGLRYYQTSDATPFVSDKDRLYNSEDISSSESINAPFVTPLADA